MVRALASICNIPDEASKPKAADFTKWSELIADTVAKGPSADEVRKHLKATSKSGWQLVNWLTHARNATRADAHIAVTVTEHILAIYGTAYFRHARGVPDRCPACGSYKIGLRYRDVEEKEGQSVPGCQACDWVTPMPS